MGATTKAEDRPKIPRSIRHKRILDRAAERPDASFEELAEDIPSATADLVEHILEEYGDPAENKEDDLDDNPAHEVNSQTSDADDSLQNEKNETANKSIEGGGGERPEVPDFEEEGTSPTEAKNENTVGDQQAVESNTSISDPAELDEKEREVLAAVAQNPELTQAEVGERLDVSGATVCTRVNGIPGFDWQNRQQFAERIFRDGEDEIKESETMAENQLDDQATLERLTERVEELENQIGEGNETSTDHCNLENSELVHKVMHACLESDTISKEEELQIVRALVR